MIVPLTTVFTTQIIFVEMQFGASGGYPTANSGKNQQRRPETRGGRNRPKTGSKGAANSDDADDFFADDEIPEDFLPA